MKDKIMSAMEKFSRAMVQPLSYISVAGMILVLGVLLTNTSVTGVLTFLQWRPINLIGTLLYECVMVIINNLGLIFAVGIAAALAKGEKHQAALIGLMVYIMFLTANNITLKTFELLAQPSEMLGLFGTGQASVLGIQVTDMGVFNGIILGCLTGYIFNKTSHKSFKGYWAMYSGTRFTFACMLAISLFLGYSVAFLWPIVQQGINFLTSVISSSGTFGLFLYGMLERLLIPTGLHHLVYAPFQFAELGGSLVVGEQVIVGAYPILMTELQMGVPFSDSMYYMATGFTKTFGYLGICAAFYHTAYPENKKKILNVLIPLALTATLAGITEPIDFMFAFAAPLLFVIHSVIAGVFVALLKVLGIHAMTTGLINSAIMNVVAGIERTNFPMMYVLAIIQILLYFFLFSYLIKKFNMMTPGRNDMLDEEEEVVEIIETDVSGVVNPAYTYHIIDGLGGKDNINTIENCFTRLRVNVKDITLVNKDLINKKANNGIVLKGSDVQVVYGVEVPSIRKEVDATLASL